MNDMDYIRLSDRIRELEDKLDNKEKREKEIREYLKKNLSIEVARRNFYSNDFTIKLFLDGNEIARDSFEIYERERNGDNY